VALLVISFVQDLTRFSSRFGIGGLIVFGGFLLWFCHDYLSNWFLSDFNLDPRYPAWVVAKMAFILSVFALSAVVGLGVRYGQWLERLMTSPPEPASNTIFLILTICLFLVGVLPYLFFTVEPFYISIYKEIVGMRSGGAQWTVGRTGAQINTSWGAYVLEMIKLGQVGGVLAVYYAILLASGTTTRMFCWLIWLFWLLIAFGSGTRGQIIFLAMPAVGLLFIKYHVQASIAFRRISIRAYVLTGILLFMALIVVQFQGRFRRESADSWDFGQVELFKARGNHMFTEGLLALQFVPESVPFFKNDFPGAGVIRPIPELFLEFVIGPIPRALWAGKPTGEGGAGQWYNRLTGNLDGMRGGTVTPNIAGSGYINYGIAGVIQYGLLFGWLCGVTERALRRAEGRTLGLFVVLGVGTYLFRAYRAWYFQDLYPIIYGVILLSVLVMITGRSGAEQTGQEFSQ